jgi:hypothetical protein
MDELEQIGQPSDGNLIIEPVPEGKAKDAGPLW